MVKGLEMHEDAAKHFKRYPPPVHPGETERIDQAIDFALFGGLPMSNSDRKVLKQNEALRSKAPIEEYLGTLRLNEIRYLLGLGLVAVDEKLADAARDHSKDMHVLGFFSHTSPVPGKERFGQRAAKFGTSAGAENIQGEDQQKLDVIANTRFARALRLGGMVCCIISEEEDELVLEMARDDQRMGVLFAIKHHHHRANRSNSNSSLVSSSYTSSSHMKKQSPV